jgi:hypothetical protein
MIFSYIYISINYCVLHMLHDGEILLLLIPPRGTTLTPPDDEWGAEPALA